MPRLLAADHLGAALLLLGLAAPAAAQSTLETPRLANLRIAYVETRPNSEIDHPALSKARAILQKFEAKSTEVKLTDSVSGRNLTAEAAERAAFEHGYLEVPMPLLATLVQAFRQRGVTAGASFQSYVRTPEQLQEVQGQLAQRLPALAQPHEFTLVLLPYRASWHDSGDAVVRVGVLLYNERSRSWVWVHYLTLPFGPSRKGFSDADGERVASILADELKQRGFLPRD